MFRDSEGPEVQSTISLNEHTGAQLRGLCHAIGLDHRADEVCAVVAGLFGPAGTRAVTEPPLWRSDVSDDHTPVEYSVSFEEDGSHTLRLLVECGPQRPGGRALLAAALRGLDGLAERYPLSLDRFDAVRDLFLPEDPRGLFSLWFSVVVTAAAVRVKVYLNPQVSGAAAAEGLVISGLDRLGFADAAAALRGRGARPCSTVDTFSFFALDLDDTPRSRVKVYRTHPRARIAHMGPLAAASPDTDLDALAEFHRVVGDTDVYDGRPLVSSHTFLQDAPGPSGFSLYLPVRDYVPDDEVALARVRALLARHGFDDRPLSRAIAAVTDRPLADGVGLIAHVSLKTGRPRPGITVYLSAEAYAVAEPGRVRAGAA
ncbi:tryptophan dimethylallyltransferase family protein [Actinokineospora enzanensis]|uniref:tryptophan dimethylallyltransferase family protein n=1 Tax=Actinokineospora enzanensis TaxID=155975 RepID=UPI00037EB6BE|nr:tryptophan dimethylallyltransferase family protein [Actinokineospora enzanensis]